MASVDTTKSQEIRALVYEFFSEECEVEVDEISDTTLIIEELEGDSLMLLALLRKVCGQHGINVELKTLGKHLMKQPADSVGDIIRLTEALVEHGDGIVNVQL